MKKSSCWEAVVNSAGGGDPGGGGGSCCYLVMIFGMLIVGISYIISPDIYIYRFNGNSIIVFVLLTNLPPLQIFFMAASVQSASKVSEEATSMLLNELVEGPGGPVTVMVFRKWDVNNVTGHYMSTDFILSDKKGNVIHSTAKNNIAHRFVDKLHEGSVYALRGFTVLPNKNEYRIMKDSPYIVELQGSTVVARVNDDTAGFVRHPFQLVDLETLKPEMSCRRHFNFPAFYLTRLHNRGVM